MKSCVKCFQNNDLPYSWLNIQRQVHSWRLGWSSVVDHALVVHEAMGLI